MVLPPPWHRHRPARTLGALGLATVATGCGNRFSAPDPVTEQGREILRLWQGSVVAALCVGALVWGLIGWSVVRYRRRNDDLPGQSPYNVPMEVLYTVVPVLVVAVLFAFTFVTQRRVVATPGRPDVLVEVIGFQWQWQFRYPEENVTVTGAPSAPPTLVLPVGRTVRFRLVSPDVIHSFWVPRFLSKRDLIPGVDNEVDVRVEKAGTWVGRCAEFCGLDHYKMNFSVRAVPAEEFRAWAASQQPDAPAGEATLR